MTPEEMIGHRISGVTASWFLTVEVQVRELLDVWLDLDGLEQVKIHAHSGIQLSHEQPPRPYEMPELGGVVEVTDGTPAPLAAVVGATVTGTLQLAQQPNGFATGFVLVTTSGSVAIVDVGDDLAIGDWADHRRWRMARIAAET